MPNTYVALRTETLATSTSSVTFNLAGISGYTDLRLVIGGTTTVTGYAFTLGVNGDTGSNYSQTLLSGNGTSAQSARYSNATNTSMYLGGWVSGYDSAAPSTILVDLMNYSNTTTNKTILWRSNSATRNTEAGVILWRNTVAITSITIYAQSGSNIAVGSTFSLYGIANADQGSAKATGGIITEDSQYWYHTFGASGAFIPKQSLTCDVLVVAGGGAGGGTYGGGGGGAGAFRTATAQSLTTISYPVTVGAGGTGGTGAGGDGTNSVFDSITSTGGGGGGIFSGGAAKNGGSGGGGSNNLSGGTGATGGNNGGTGNQTENEGLPTGGGGGGAGAAGSAAVFPATGGNGGNGSSSSLSGLSVTYAGGGGGGVDSRSIRTKIAGTGGTGGGGNGSISGNGSNGTTNLGGGGGGSGFGTTGTGGNGGSGIVIIRYAK